jgi:hypothetical protein
MLFGIWRLVGWSSWGPSVTGHAGRDDPALSATMLTARLRTAGGILTARWPSGPLLRATLIQRLDSEKCDGYLIGSALLFA